MYVTCRLLVVHTLSNNFQSKAADFFPLWTFWAVVNTGVWKKYVFFWCQRCAIGSMFLEECETRFDIVRLVKAVETVVECVWVTPEAVFFKFTKSTHVKADRMSLPKGWNRVKNPISHVPIFVNVDSWSFCSYQIIWGSLQSVWNKIVLKNIFK